MKPKTTNCMSAAAIRQSYLDFFQDRAGHTIVPSGPVVPHDDPTLLFANAGMNQFKDVFLGTGSRPWTRAVDTQKCIRAGGKHNDLEDVGRDTWHHTFFEMLGNWSFGDYFKAEAIEWAWELLTEVWGLPKDRLFVTVFAGDEEEGLEPDTEAERLWREKTDIDPTHISRWGKKDNFWEMGASGPCGPCSEIHFDSTPDNSGGPLVNLDHPDVIEVWNLVFIEYNRREDGTLVPLPSKHVDTGMGLERIVRVLQGVRSNYDTDLWTPIFEAIQRETGAAAYTGSMDSRADMAYRVIADHIRCLVVAMTDGALPGPDGRGFVLRRILRRGVRMARQALGAEEPLLCRLVPTVVDSLSGAFPELIKTSDDVAAVIKQEEEAFLKTLDRGLVMFAGAADEAKAGDGRISGHQAFLLHDTFGFPIDLTAQMAEEQGIALDRDGFDAAMEQARTQSRGEDAGSDLVAALPPEAIASLEKLGGHGTDDSPKYERSLCIGHVRGIWNGKDLVEHATAGERVAVVLDRTTFYAEQGGQIGDTGKLITEAEGDSPGGLAFRVENTTRSGPWVLHIGHLVEGTLHLSAAVDARVDARRHAAIEANHTATHLLNRALRSVLGDHCDQRGSLVAADRLRFDYAAREAPTVEHLAEVEQIVLKDIAAGLVVDAAEVPLDTAMGIAGVRAIFGEQYPDPVRVVCVGSPVTQLTASPGNAAWMSLSTEFCGGTHLADTSDIGDFIIMQEQSLASGVRRIVAASGDEAAQMRQAGDVLLDRLNAIASLDEQELPDAVDAMMREFNDAELGLLHRRAAEHSLNGLRDTTKKLRKAAAGESKGAAVTEAQALAHASEGDFIVGELTAHDRETLLAGMDAVRGISPDAACLLACRVDESGKVIIVAKVPQALIDRGLKAGDWVRTAAEACGGGGGGRPDAAQAGGKQPEKLPDALAAATAHAQEALT
jgi:alanyl-tRNA synthetase